MPIGPTSQLPATLAWLSCDLGPVAKAGGLSDDVFSWTTADRASQYQKPIVAAAQEFGVSVDLLNALAYTESRFQPGARSPANASGMFQFIPSTWAAVTAAIGEKGKPTSDVNASARAAAFYLRKLIDRWDGNVRLALASYNWGAGNVKKVGDNPDRWPTETQRHVANTLRRAEKFRQLRALCATQSPAPSPSPSPQPSPSPRPPSPSPTRPRPSPSPSPSPRPPASGGDSGGGGLLVAAVVVALVMGGGIR